MWNLCCDTFGGEGGGGWLGGLQKLEHAWLESKLSTKTGGKVLSVGVLHSMAVVWQIPVYPLIKRTS